MNPSAEESLMALLEAMLTLAAGGEARRQPTKPPVNPGGYPEEQFLDLTEQERDELSCSICYQILKETMQCANNHKFCHSCLVVWSTTGQYANRIRCPVCRTRGVYMRNDEFDDRVGAKRVKCHLESCTWTGLAKYLNSHRHNTYGNESQQESEDKTGGSTSTSIPRLTQATPRLPPTGSSRFIGTGLTTLGGNDSPTQASTSTSTRVVPLLGARAASRASPSSLSSASQETVVEISIPRQSGMASSINPLSGPTAITPRRVSLVRGNGNNRITFSHTRPIRDANNNVGASQATNPLLSTRASIPGTVESIEGGLHNSTSGGLVPRPPSAPRTTANPVNTRRLPRIINPPPQRNPEQQNSMTQQPQQSQSQPAASGLALPSRSTNPTTNLTEIRGHLQDSRSRLHNLMSSFSGELDRSRQEMMDFQHERERQRREQLEEVRELGQRLGQVAFELRRLLEQRRQIPSFSDSDEDSDI